MKHFISTLTDIPRSLMKLFQELKFRFQFCFISLQIVNEQNLLPESDITLAYAGLLPRLSQIYY